MLAPIITKDMRLFPTKKVPVKNVRSRAQSLDQFQQIQNSSNTIDRFVKTKSSASTGNLPQKASRSRNKDADKTMTAPKTPPKSMTRKSTLSAIQEGVELAEGSPNIMISHSCSESSSVLLETSVKTRINSSNDTNSEDNEEGAVEESPKKKRGVLRWITNSFRKSSRDKISDNRSTSSG